MESMALSPTLPTDRPPTLIASGVVSFFPHRLNQSPAGEAAAAAAAAGVTYVDRYYASVR